MHWGDVGDASQGDISDADISDAHRGDVSDADISNAAVVT